MTRVVILTLGSQGDVRPYAALGLGLLRAGYQVRLGAPAEYKDFLTSMNLDFCAVHGEMPERPEKDSTDRSENGNLTLPWATSVASFNPFKTIYRMLRLNRQSEEALRSILQSTWIACQGADCVVGSYLAVGGLHVAEAMRIPYLWALLYPAGRTGTFPYFLAPYRLLCGRHYNSLSHVVAEQLFWQLQRPVVDNWRSRNLHLPRLRFSSPYNFHQRPVPVVYGFSSALVPKPEEWGDHMQVVGPWFLDDDLGWQPPQDLLSFIVDRHDPPVSIELGSVSEMGSDDLIALATAALTAANRRGIVLTGDVRHRGNRVNDWVYALNWAPHYWLFPQLGALVHHAGVGTTADGLRCGLPTVTLPQYSDQWFWARRVAEARAGPPPIPRHLLTAGKLADAIRIATTDAKMHAAAQKLGRSIAAEDGVERLVAIVRDLCPLRGTVNDQNS
jgi:sterol 3beta-glucosyltransferase